MGVHVVVTSPGRLTGRASTQSGHGFEYCCRRGQPPYGQATRVLAAEWAGDGIRVNQLNPGFVRTDTFSARQTAENIRMLTEQFTKLHPLGRVGEVEDIAALAAFLVSEQAAWITGAMVDVDGGFSVQGARFPAGR